MTTRLGVALKNARLQAVLDKLDAGASHGTVKLYTSPRIAAIGDTPTGTLVATLDLAEPCGSVTSGVATLGLPADSAVIADGVVTWALWCDGDGNQVMDTDVGNLASSAEVRISNTNCTVGMLLTTYLANMT